MAPQVEAEFVILKLKFDPFITPQYPRIEVKSEKHSPSGSLTETRDWFDRIMSSEISKLHPNMSVRYLQWNIDSGNTDLLTINGNRFDNFILILGEEAMHWVFYKKSPQYMRIEGRCRLTKNYCNCCFDTQYLKIIKNIKNCLMKQGGCN